MKGRHLPRGAPTFPFLLVLTLFRRLVLTSFSLACAIALVFAVPLLGCQTFTRLLLALTLTFAPLFNQMPMVGTTGSNETLHARFDLRIGHLILPTPWLSV